MEKTVEAVICGHEITSAEVDAFIASLPRENSRYTHPIRISANSVLIS